MNFTEVESNMYDIFDATNINCSIYNDRLVCAVNKVSNEEFKRLSDYISKNGYSITLSISYHYKLEIVIEDLIDYGYIERMMYEIFDGNVSTLRDSDESLKIYPMEPITAEQMTALYKKLITDDTYDLTIIPSNAGTGLSLVVKKKK